MPRRRLPKTPYDPDASVTFTPDGDGSGVISCSWEEEPRRTRITREAAEGVAYGFGVLFKVEASW